MQTPYTLPLAALETMNAKWWQIRLAKLLGRKHVARCETTGYEVTTYQWRGRTYFTDFKEPPSE